MEAHVGAAFRDDGQTPSQRPAGVTEVVAGRRRTVVGALKAALVWLLSAIGLGKH